MEADFRELAVRIRLERVGRTSITWAWEILCGGEICVDGRHTVVHVDPEGRPAPLPGRVRERLGG